MPEPNDTSSNNLFQKYFLKLYFGCTLLSSWARYLNAGVINFHLLTTQTWQ